MSWAVTTLVVLYLLTSAATGLVGGTFGTVSSALGGAGNVVDVEPDAVQMGMRVAVAFEPMSDTISLPLFRPEAS